MAGAIIVGVISAIGAGVSYSGQKSAAASAARASEAAALHAEQAAELERQQLLEQHAFDIALAEEQIALEEKIALESTQFVTEQIAKRDSEVRAAAIAGYAASGVDPYEEGSSALSVVDRIKEESLTEQGRVLKGYETFVETRGLELEQLKESSGKTYDWFTQQSEFELAYELKSRHAEASMYRSQARYAGYGMYAGSLGSGLSAGFKTHLMIQ